MSDPSSSYHKPHRAPQAGVSFAKKKKRDLDKKQVKDSRKNPHAFAFRSSNRAVRSQRRNLDVGVQRQHLPIHSHVASSTSVTTPSPTDAATAASPSSPPPAPVDAPPFLVVIIGPAGTGKSSIISSLVKHHTGHSVPLSHLHGPLTLLTSSNRRLTLIECPPHLHCLIDLAKCADLVLLTVDASFGFEMETFEALNVLKQHGFPKVMGVLTHLDHFRTNAQLNAVKKKMKHRFWTEICDGAKLFYLSGVINGKYLKREVANLARFISVMKYRPLQWRSQHPYIVADRMEDLTPAAALHDNPSIDRRIALYGYVRGTLLHPTQLLHWMGVGDYRAASFTLLDDPVPIKHRKAEGGGGRRAKLNEKEKRMYAPMSDLGEVVYDDDVMYISLKDRHVHYSREEMIVRGEGEETREEREKREEAERRRTGGVDEDSLRMVKEMQGARVGVDEKLSASHIQVFKGARPITEEDIRAAQEEVEADGEDDDEAEGEEGKEDEEEKEKERISSEEVVHRGRLRRRVVFGDEEELERRAQKGDQEGVEDDDEGMEKDDEDGPKGNGEADDEYYRDNWDEVKGQLGSGRALIANGTIALPSQSHKQRPKESKAATNDNEAVPGEDEDEGDEEANDGDDEDVEESADADDGAEDEGKAGPALTGGGWDDVRDLTWKEDLVGLAATSFKRSVNLMDLVYGADTAARNNAQRHAEQAKATSSRRAKLQLFDDDEDGEEGDEEGKAGGEDDEDELFRRAVRDVTMDDVDSVVVSLKRDEQRETEAKDWQDPDVYAALRNKFVTGDWSEEVKGVGGDVEEEDSEAEEEERRRKRKERKGRRGKGGRGGPQAAGEEEDEDDYDGDEGAEWEDEDQHISVEDDGARADETEEQAEERRRGAKEALKASFDSTYDKPSTSAEGEEGEDHLASAHTAATQQSELSASAFSSLPADRRLLLEGARPGHYVRIELHNVPAEFVQHFSPSTPLVLGGLLATESSLGFVQVRVKKHRWHRRILKSHDPLIFSLGWRRFQSCPVYAMEDANGRLRFLKYTPEHMHCMAVTYAPLTPPNTPFVCYQYTDSQATFRIAATGTTLAQSKAGAELRVVKKLKLLGYPYRIFKHTAYVKDMFTSSVEVARFTGAVLRTVSGIRGAVKRAVKTEGQDGVFRATFEDKLVASDIIVCRSWSTVDVLPYYAPVQSLLAPGGAWRGLRTIRQIRAEDNVPLVAGPAGYGGVVRGVKKFAPLYVPKGLARELPFAAKEKVMRKRASNRRLYDEARMVVRSEGERDMYRLMQQVNTVKGVKEEKRKEQRQRQRERWQKSKEKEEAKHAPRNREVRKRKYVAEGMGRVVKQKRYSDK